MKTTATTTSSPLNDLSHDSEAIPKDADTLVDKSSRDRRNANVLLNKKKKKYWVEKASPDNCFMVYARDLGIIWGDTPSYWHWPRVKETSDMEVEVAELLAVCWLHVGGKFEMGKLTPGIKYEVVFAVMMKDVVYGWHIPINIKLTLPDGNTQEHKENLMKKPKSKWFEIPGGEFIVDAKKGGSIEFLMYEHGGHWKKGLVIKGVAIRPKVSPLHASPGNCFMVHARDLGIIWGGTPSYWHWPRIKETSDMDVEVAELLDVCWLHVGGKFEMGKLTPGIKYEVVFVVMMKDVVYGWYIPINFKLTLPDGNTQEHKENLMEKPKSKWFEIPGGEFIVDAKKGGSIEFLMYEHGGHWKKGLVIKGVAIRPKF